MYRNNFSCGWNFLQRSQTSLPDHSMFFHEIDQKQPSENWKAKDGFSFVFVSAVPLTIALFFSSQLSPAVSGQDEEETETDTSPPNQREMSDSPQHHGVWKGISLFIWRKLGRKNRLKTIPQSRQPLENNLFISYFYELYSILTVCRKLWVTG